jgi:hypothetical protein
VILAVLAISGWGVAAFFWLRTPVVQPQEPYLLGPLLTDKSRPTTIVLDDPMLPQAWPMIGKLMTLDDFVAGRYLDPKYYETEVGRFIGTMLKDNYIVHLSSLQSLLHISEIARSNGVNPIPAHSRTMQPQKLENGNFVFLGGVGSNPWVGEIQKHLAFEHQVDPNQGLRTFVNRSPRAGEPALFKSLINDAHTHYYTRVAVVKNPFGAGKVALLGGTSREATEAAYQFALSQTGLDQVQRLCGVPLSKLSDFELILETKSLAGAPVTRTIVASRCGIN